MELYYFSGVQSKAFTMVRNVPKFLFGDKIGHAKFAGIRLYLAI